MTTAAPVTDLLTYRGRHNQPPLYFASAREALEYAVDQLEGIRQLVHSGALLVPVDALAGPVERAYAIVDECRRLHVGYRGADHHEEGQQQ